MHHTSIAAPELKAGEPASRYTDVPTSPKDRLVMLRQYRIERAQIKKIRKVGATVLSCS